MPKRMLRDVSKDIIKIEPLDDGGFKMENSNPDGTNWSAKYYGLVSYKSLQKLEGKILTMMDAMFTDKEQRKAAKDVFREMFWFTWVEDGLYKGRKINPEIMLKL